MFFCKNYESVQFQIFFLSFAQILVCVLLPYLKLKSTMIADKDAKGLSNYRKRKTRSASIST